MRERLHKHAKFKVKKYPLLFLTVFLCLFFALQSYGMRVVYGYGLLSIISFFFLFQRKTRLTVQKKSFFLCATFTLLWYIASNAKRDMDSLIYILNVVICCILVLISNPGEREVKKTVKILYATSIIFCISNLFFTGFRNLYVSFVAPFLRPEYADYYYKSISTGYGQYVGSYSYNNYILAAGIMVASGYLVSHKYWDIKKRLVLFSLPVLLIAIFITGRRSELLAVLVSCVLIFILSVRKNKRIVRLLIIANICVICLFFLFAFMPELESLGGVFSRYIQTIQDFKNGKDVTTGRVQLWSLAWQLFLTEPVWGIGWGRYLDFVSLDFVKKYGEITGAHNIYLQFLCETGIIGTIMILAPIIVCYYTTFKQLLKLIKFSPNNTKNNLLLWIKSISFMGQTFLFLLGFIDPVFQKHIFWCFYSIFVILSSVSLKYKD